MSNVVVNVLVAPYSEKDREAWNSYVDSHNEGSFFHLIEWSDVIQDVFNHTPHYLVATQDARIVGLLPLVELKSLLFGHSLVSTPFCVYGGAIADSPEIKKQLEDESVALGRKLSVDYVELRCRKASDNPLFEVSCQHSTFGWELSDGPEAILAAVKKKQRANIRHSLKKALEVAIDQDADTAYDIYSESVRNLGTPVFDPKYFPALVKYFGDKTEVLTVKSGGKPISSVLSFYYKDEVLPYYGGGTFDARGLKSNDLMYYTLMCHAQEKGCNRFDFGRSKNDSGAFKYKATWGMEPEPLHYMRALINATEQPNLSPNNPKYALFINTWKKLPLWLSRLLGPFLSKYLG
ncbi:FemAB family XrtA/PEP-CTERM system-associated protein [Aestuariibacter salexigens]|uniref:FemAB family XrtA/PEP-CTERM system-associated protein n=1 Tax=Aestuariibacter salexigens TaxID=226010 RepID=UPI0003F5260B|nr:FemAB family XrtA/PEP-CTERM system-associated protein [Aestuariibacter salexigens]